MALNGKHVMAWALASIILIGLELNGDGQHAFFIKGHQLKKLKERDEWKPRETQHRKEKEKPKQP